MTNRKIRKIKRELYEIQTRPRGDGKLERIRTLAKSVLAPIPDAAKKTQKDLVDALIRNIHMVLQTEMMLNACISAKRSCFWAAIAAIAACFSIILSSVGMYFTMCLK